MEDPSGWGVGVELLTLWHGDRPQLEGSLEYACELWFDVANGGCVRGCVFQSLQISPTPQSFDTICQFHGSSVEYHGMRIDPSNLYGTPRHSVVPPVDVHGAPCHSMEAHEILIGSQDTMDSIESITEIFYGPPRLDSIAYPP